MLGDGLCARVTLAQRQTEVPQGHTCPWSRREEEVGRKKNKTKSYTLLWQSSVAFIEEISSCPQTPCESLKSKAKRKLRFSYLIRFDKDSWVKSDTHYTHKHNISHD